MLPLPGPGVPASRPVTGSKVTPDGRGPDSDSVTAGNPVAVTVKVPGAPTVNVVLLALVMAAVWLTVKVNDWLASGPAPLTAVKVIGKLVARRGGGGRGSPA